MEINGHSGLYYQHPKLNYVGGDWATVVAPIGSADTIIAEIPPDFLVKGTNKLVLTAVDEPTRRDDVTRSGIYYDALALAVDRNASFNRRKVSVQVEPTIFYRQDGDSLVELVNVFVGSNRSLERGRVTLKLAGRDFTHEFTSKRDFGQERVEFKVPEFAPDTAAEVIARIGGETQPFPFQAHPCEEVDALCGSARAPGHGLHGLSAQSR